MRRRLDSHKGDYGHVLVIGGAQGMTGAPILCAMAALRSGAGLVSLAAPEKVYPLIDRKAPPEIMVHPLPGALPSLLKKADVLAVGPGLGRGPAQKALVRRLLAQANQPLVIDADAIIALKGFKGQLKASSSRKRGSDSCPRSGRGQAFRGNDSGPLILTPHPGEMAGLLGISIKEVQAGRKEVALKTARRLGAVLLLKGHRTVIAGPDGRIRVNTTGNPGMATAGMGDVLTGLIAALIGQGLEAFDAAVAGAHLHGLAGDLAAKKVGQVSLTAGDVLAHLPAAFQRSVN